MSTNKNFRLSDESAEAFRKLSKLAEESQDKTMQKLLKCGSLYEIHERHPDMKGLLDAIIDNWIGFADSVKALVLVNETSVKRLDDQYRDRIAADDVLIASLNTEKRELEEKIVSLTQSSEELKTRIKSLESENQALRDNKNSIESLKAMVAEYFPSQNTKK